MRFESIKVSNIGQLRTVDLDLSAIPGSLVAVTGENGSGKSTLLGLLHAAIYRTVPTRGSLTALATSRHSRLEVRAVNGSTWTFLHEIDGVSKKSEAVVVDAAGQSVSGLDGAKVRAMDAWVEQHMPAPSVALASTFAAQGSGGFLSMSPGERKSVLLNLLGVEHLEVLAERAREQLRAATVSTRVTMARLEETPALAPVDVEAAERAEAFALERLALEHADLTSAEATLSRARTAWQKHTAELAKLEALEVANTADARKVRAIDARIADARKLVERGAEIRDAAARAASLATEIDRTASERREDAKAADLLRRRVESERERAEKAKREAASADAAAVSHANAAEAAERRLAEAAAELAELAASEGRVAAEVAARQTEVDELRARQVVGAEGRIEALRVALNTIAWGTIGEKAAPTVDRYLAIAQKALAADDAAARDAVEVPPALRAAEAALWNAKHGAQGDRELAAELREQAIRLTATRDDHAARRAESIARAAAAREAQKAAEDLLNELDAERYQADQRVELHAERYRAMRDEAAEIAPLAAQLRALDAAEGLIAELQAQLEQLGADACRRKAEADALDLPAPGCAPQEPDESHVVTLRARHQAAIEDAARARAAVETARRDADAAKAADERRAALTAELATLTEHQADWSLLADALGRDGLQAAEVDAAGPELTELVNDLLRTCVGPRWAVTIETQRLSADGKRLLEGCEVRVLDTVAGREGAAETFSGGERVLLGEAVSLALSMLACRRAGLVGVTLVRDETGAALDPANGRAYVAMLRRAAELVGARQVLYVSHSPELAELADARIVVGGGTAVVA